MKFETALKKPRTIVELMKLTGLSRGGVLQSLRRFKAKKAGSKRVAERGPESTLYVMRKGYKATPKRKYTRRTVTETPAENAQLAMDLYNTPVPTEITGPVEFLEQAPAANENQEDAVETTDAGTN